MATFIRINANEKRLKQERVTESLCAQSLSRVQLFVIPWTVAHQAPLSLEFSRQEYSSGLPFPSPGDLLGPGIEPVSPESPELAGRFFTTEPRRGPWNASLSSSNGYQKGNLRVSFSGDSLQPPALLFSPQKRNLESFLGELSFTDLVNLRSSVFSINKAAVPSVAWVVSPRCVWCLVQNGGEGVCGRKQRKDMEETQRSLLLLKNVTACHPWTQITLFVCVVGAFRRSRSTTLLPTVLTKPRSSPALWAVRILGRWVGITYLPKQPPELGRKLNSFPGFLSLFPSGSNTPYSQGPNCVFSSKLGSPRNQGLCLLCFCNLHDLA